MRYNNIHIFKALRLNKSPFESLYIGKRKRSRTDKHSSQRSFRKGNWEGVAYQEVANKGELKLGKQEKKVFHKSISGQLCSIV